MTPPVYPLPFIYESTGAETRFTNGYDPDARSRRVFTFHRPETLAEWLRQIAESPDLPTFRARLKAMPPLDERGLWGKQAEAIRNLERSLAEDRPRSLIQMATGSGKTFTAANACYRLIKHADSKRILFLVDRSNLGKQAKLEFDKFTIQETQRKFPAEYNVQHLTSNTIDATSRVCISTVQRIFSILKGEAELDQEIDEHSVYELPVAEPVEVSYNPALPPDTFDVIIIDECHRSIYGLWRQVLEYFDAHLIGLTATPTKQTFGFFRQNLVMEYSHDMAVTDGVNVDFTVYKIETAITKAGSTIEAGEFAGYRDRQTRKVRWDAVDEPIEYAAAQLDRAVVAEDQIRTVIQTFNDKLFTELFPGRRTVPKTLIFSKDDSHADDVVQIVREVFGKGNQFATKITYRTRDGKPDDLLQAFRNSMYPRIVVTVDMIATGTDVKPLECLVFMRGVKSRTYFEQMLGRGVRVINDTEFQAVTDDAKRKERFIVVDAVGIMDTPLAETVQPLERMPAKSLKDLFKQVAFGSKDSKIASSIAGRLARLDKHLTSERQEPCTHPQRPNTAGEGRRMSDSATIVQKLWNYCNVLRDDGLSYQDYIEQLTFLLFLKMADEQTHPPFSRSAIVPKGLDWASLVRLDGDDLEVHYRHILGELGKWPGTLGVIFRKAQNKIQDPAKLKRLVSDLIDREQWMTLDADVKGDAYEGLLAKNAEDVKTGAGQYFTPRPLIRATIDVMRPTASMRVCDPAAGTGGFLLAAYEQMKSGSLDPDEKRFLRDEALRGWEIVDATARLCAMNLLLHGISAPESPSLITVDDSLRSAPSDHFDMVLTNPPFGRKSSYKVINAQGDTEREDMSYLREDFWATTSNKQLNFLQHVQSLLTINGRAAIVAPDNVLFEGGAGETIRRRLLEQCDAHTLLRLPTGIFYAGGVKANVLFFDRKPPSEKPWTDKLWIYDFRTNQNFTLKTRALVRADLDDFVACYNPANRQERTETERFRAFSYDELVARDKASLDIFWLRDESLEDTGNLLSTPFEN